MRETAYGGVRTRLRTNCLFPDHSYVLRWLLTCLAGFECLHRSIHPARSESVNVSSALEDSKPGLYPTSGCKFGVKEPQIHLPFRQNACLQDWLGSLGTMSVHAFPAQIPRNLREHVELRGRESATETMVSFPFLVKSHRLTVTKPLGSFQVPDHHHMEINNTGTEHPSMQHPQTLPKFGLNSHYNLPP
jgi:hypothetical protein